MNDTASTITQEREISGLVAKDDYQKLAALIREFKPIVCTIQDIYVDTNPLLRIRNIDGRIVSEQKTLKIEEEERFIEEVQKHEFPNIPEALKALNQGIDSISRILAKDRLTIHRKGFKIDIDIYIGRMEGFVKIDVEFDKGRGPLAELFLKKHGQISLNDGITAQEHRINTISREQASVEMPDSLVFQMMFTSLYYAEMAEYNQNYFFSKKELHPLRGYIRECKEVEIQERKRSQRQETSSELRPY